MGHTTNLSARVTAATALITLIPLIPLIAPVFCTQTASEERLATSAACLMTGNTAASDTFAGHLRANYATFTNVRLRHWDRAEVTVAVGTTDTRRSPEETDRLVRQAAALWNEQGPSAIRTVVDASGNAEVADVVIRFLPARSMPRQVLGRTTVVYGSASGILRHAEILVTEGLSEDACQQAVAHELGHALGIQGHSPNGDDLMYPRAHLPAVVTASDANTLRIAYGASESDELPLPDDPIDRH